MAVHPIQTGPLYVNTCVVPLAGNAVLLVDPAGSAYSDDETALADYLLGRGLVPIGILLTHGHFDHVLGLKPLRASFPDIQVAIHGEDAPFIGKNSLEAQAKSLAFMGLESDRALLLGLSDLPEADFLLSDGETLDKYFTAFNGPDKEAVLKALAAWRVIHTPGHTRGSVCFYSEPEKILISGDTVFYHSYGRTDLPGGSEAQIQESLRKIFDELPPETLVYPGHERTGFKLGNNL